MEIKNIEANVAIAKICMVAGGSTITLRKTRQQFAIMPNKFSEIHLALLCRKLYILFSSSRLA